jgi:uncharacterized sporulation protein YeaH/YhbH (DUF444 family)
MRSGFIIDRRLNPKGKSLANRQRFIRRTRAQIRDAVKKSVGERTVSDPANGDAIRIPTKGISEPRFQHAGSGGKRTRVYPGNKEFGEGDRLPKPPGGGAGGGGKKASDSGDGEDGFEFSLTREEFLDLFFEDLALPDLVKTGLKEVVSYKSHRAGLTISGSAANLNLVRTMRNSFARRLALKRPSGEDLLALERRVLELEAKSSPTPEERIELKETHEAIEKLKSRRRLIPYIDPSDVRYNYFEMRPSPNTQAVMFCLMDVSGSMAQYEKDLAKRFFMLLHLFLERRYGKIDIVFIRHTHEAKEVDEETFFYGRETGGTIVSTALIEMQKVLKDRYPTDEWNIYAAQASDGDDWSGAAEKCVSILENELMPLCQYYSYVEILDEREMEAFANEENGAELWRSYRTVANNWPNFAMKRISKPGDIFPVFRELFSEQKVKA